MKLYTLVILLSVLIMSNAFAYRVLCLHGGGGNAASLSAQQGMQSLVSSLPNVEFVFASSPVAGGVWYPDPPSKDSPTTDSNWADASISYLDNFIIQNGPFDAILGYSQGVPMTLVYLSQTNINFDKVLLFNGYLPTTHLGLMSLIDAAAPFQENSLIFIGQNDYYFRDIGYAVKSKFANYTEIVSEVAGHHLPYDSDATFSTVVDFLSATTNDNTEVESQNFTLETFSSTDLQNWELIDTKTITSSAGTVFLKSEITPIEAP